MKRIMSWLLSILLLSSGASTWSQVTLNPSGSGDDDSMNTLIQYVQNLGAYFGFDVSTKPSWPGGGLPPSPVTLIHETFQKQSVSWYTYFSWLGAIPVNMVTSPLSRIVPTSSPLSSTVNSYANKAFSNYNATNSSQGAVSVSPQIDQQTYQQDPVSQAVLNILTTPDYSYCLTSTADTASYDKGCSNLSSTVLTDFDITRNFAAMPSTSVTSMPAFRGSQNIPPNQWEFFTYAYNVNFLAQLNSNSLTGPLLYDTSPTATAPQSGTQSEGGSQQASDTQMSQAQVAANFIRYALGTVTPLPLASWSDYAKLYKTATTQPKGNESNVNMLQAQASLNNYLAKLRVYAAQNSVAASNLYYILAKRVPQSIPQSGQGENSGQSSEALNEFKLATWRIFPSNTANNPNADSWVNQINNASMETVQKEIAVLLAEINYQLYLTRQQDERLLLTNSMLLLQASQRAQPYLTTNQ